MQLAELLEIENIEYNQFVAQMPTGSFLQSWQWGEWQESLGRQIFRYWILDDGGEKIGSIQLIKMPLPMGQYYLYAPYGPVLAEGGQLPSFAKASAGRQVTSDKLQVLLNKLKNEFPDAVFIRIEPKSVLLPTTHYPLLAKSPNIQPGKTLIINLNKSSDELLAGMHHKTRYNIKLAQKHGVKIKSQFDLSIGNGLFAKEAVDLIVQTAERQHYKGFGRNYYSKIINFFMIKRPGNLKIHIYKAIYNNLLLASAILADFGRARVYLFGGSSEENKNLMAPYLLHFQAMMDAKAAGLTEYDFWGLETSAGEAAGFARFKLGFAPQPSVAELASLSADPATLNGQVAEYAGAYDIINNQFKYFFYKLFRKCNLAFQKAFR